MDTTTLLITGQLILLLLAAIVFLVLYARKQRKAVSDLQDLLFEYKEDLNGNHLTRYFELSIDDTTAHSSQETVALKPGAAPDQMAISLRYHALTAELSLLQTYNGELSPWKSAIDAYNDLAAKIHDHIQKAPESVKAELIPKIDALEKELNESRSQYEQIKNQIDNYKRLDSVYKDSSRAEVDKKQLEIQLHHALLALADNVENAAAIREVIYLMHEGYLNSKDGADSSNDAEPLSAEDSEAMHDLIEKFTEESAELVERVYLLNNENKMLNSENEDLKRQIHAYTNQEGIDEESAPIVAGLKMKIESQVEEILRLQSNFKHLEDKYLALYADKLDVNDTAASVANKPSSEQDEIDELPDMDLGSGMLNDEPEVSTTEEDAEPESIAEAEADEVKDSEDETDDTTGDEESVDTSPTDSPPTEDDDVDPDAILAEMNEMTATMDSKKSEK